MRLCRLENISISQPAVCERIFAASLETQWAQKPVMLHNDLYTLYQQFFKQV